ncbi:tetratricopeptide repeat protein [Anatilimnocola floriformis]|uniref:tetratricopeptide repeat protein n=1 Tax=Anatilimnocola floriformis TaxID=2948575 RepID=UPI0020C3BD9B|nr:tetratricopeptide repeat protein [Anatilimnocola floriformis]
MISLPLSIRYREQPQHAAVAWLVPGDDLGLWMEEWLRWNLPQADWRIAVLPGWGALTILPAGQKPVVAPRAIPFGRAGSRWYLPLHAELLPAATKEELESLLPSDLAAAVFHPARGLLTIEPGELRGIEHLLLPPMFSAQDWTRAQPGEALNDRLLSVQPNSLPSLAEVLQQGRDDIGSQGDQINELPPRPNEPGNGLLDQMKRGMSQVGLRALGGMAGMIGAAMSYLPGLGSGVAPAGGSRGSAGSGGGAAGPGWLDSLSKWVTKRLGAISQQLEDQRNKEIQRLMHLLQNNPDEGLKFAIPFSSSEHRGVAPPSGSLGSREVNFNLNRIGGGGPADHWNLSPQYQLQLAQRYRELANRELQLGRHRRAAYIFAELLGDFLAAASALAAGEHWREAAVLYRDRLNQPKKAAECLERGGLLHEAIALYEPLREFEKIGDLYLRLEQKEEAITAWRQAAQAAEGNREYFKAAHLFENKIGLPQEAEQVLQRSWHSGHQLRESLEKLFELYLRQQWHDRAHQRIAQLRDTYSIVTIGVVNCEALATVARNYPDQQVADYAADTARLIIGTHLPQADKPARTRLVTSLQQLVPGDQLLTHDGQRYLRERDVAQSAKAQAPAKAQPKKTDISRKDRPVRLVREFQQDKQIAWEAAAAAGSYFWAIGNDKGVIVIAAVCWQGRVQRKWINPRGVIEAAHIAADPQGHGPLLIATGFGQQEASFEMHSPQGITQAVLFEGAQGAADATRFTRVSVCYALGRAFFIERDAATGYLVANGRMIGAKQTLGEIVTTFDVCEADPDNAILPTHGRNDLLAIGYQQVLRLIRGPEEIEELEFSGPIRQIAGSAPFTRTRLAVVTDNGTFVVWLQGREASAPIGCGYDLQQPVACFTLGGHLVLAGVNGGEVYETSNVGLKLCHTFANFGFAPIAVLPTDEPNEFAVVGPNGAVRIYAIG